jgi:hypothetical protein
MDSRMRSALVWLPLFFLLASFGAASDENRHVVVIDAGSTGSRL